MEGKRNGFVLIPRTQVGHLSQSTLGAQLGPLGSQVRIHSPFFGLVGLSPLARAGTMFREADRILFPMLLRRRAQAQRGGLIPPRSHSQEEAGLAPNSDFRV